MGRMFSEKVEDILAWRSDNVVDSVDLIKLIVAGKQRAQGQYLVHNASDTPNIHFVSVVSISKKTFRSAVPSCRNVLSEWHFLIETPATSQICQFHSLSIEKDVFWLYVSMKDAISMHMLDGLDQLKHVVLDPLLRQVIRPSFNCLVKVLLHEFKN